MKQRGVWAVSVGLVALGASGLLLAPGCSGDPVLGDRVENVEDLGQVSQSLVGAWSFVGAPFGVWQGLTNNQYTGVVKDIEATGTYQRIAALGTAWQRSAATGWGWVPMSDSLIPPGDPADGVQFSAIASKPSNSNRVVLGTGDGSTHSHQGDTSGAPGLYVSNNANSATPTWSQVLDTSATGGSVRRIRWRHDNMVFAATNNGLWKSTNSGDTWSRVLNGSVTDVAIGVNSQLYAAVRGEGLKRSSDWGMTWSYCHPTAGPDPTFDVSKIGEGGFGVVYLLRGKLGGFEGVYRILDSPAPGSCVSTKYNNVNLAALGTMPDWYGTIAAHPNFTNTLLVGGIGVQRTQNAQVGANASWSDVSTGLHGDVHDLTFLGDGSDVLYAAEDAGVWYSLQAGAGWFYDANSFKAMSIHDFDIAPNASRIYGARWHAGPFTTDLSSANSWTSSTTSSDAFAATIDPFVSSRGWYSMWPGGCRYRTTDSGATWLDANSGIGCSFEDYAPIEHDKVHQIYIYTLYQGKPYKSINLGQSWTAYQSTPLFFTGLAVGRYSGGASTVYAFNNVLWASKAGSAFVDITPPGGSVDRVITHPTQVNTAYAVTPTKIYKTTTANAGSWVNITANFTPASVVFKDVVVDPQNDQILFAATTHGVYKTTNGGTTWVRWVNGFANGGSKEIWRLRTVDLRSTGQGLWIYAAVGSSGIWKRDASTDGG